MLADRIVEEKQHIEQVNKILRKPGEIRSTDRAQEFAVNGDAPNAHDRVRSPGHSRQASEQDIKATGEVSPVRGKKLSKLWVGNI